MKNNIKKRIFAFIMTILAIFLVTILIIIWALMSALDAVENPITDVKYYKREIKGHLLKVFPSDIPDNVEKVEFYYAPGILQGGTNYSLYYVDKNMTMDKFDKKYKNKAIWIGHKDEYTEKMGLLTGAFSYTPAEYENEDDYIIYLIEGNCDNSGYCNHGKFLMTAYNEKTNEVIFRSERW